MNQTAEDMEGSSGQLVYECPHCKHQLTVDAGLISETVNCPNKSCGKPFQVSPPPGRLISDSRTDVADASRNVVSGAADVETDVVTSHPAMFGQSPGKFLGLWLVVIVGLVALIGAMVGLAENLPLSGFVLMLIGAVLLIIGGTAFGYWLVLNKFQVLIVTTERTIYRRGIFTKKTSEVQHDDVRNIQMDQSIFQRLINVGDIAISSAGQSDMEIDVRGFKRPNEVVELIRKYQ